MHPCVIISFKTKGFVNKSQEKIKTNTVFVHSHTVFWLSFVISVALSPNTPVAPTEDTHI